MDVVTLYQKKLSERGFIADAAQERAILALQTLYEAWIQYKNQRANRLFRLVRPPKVPRGIYLWGGVGRGKSFLMDSFYSVLPIKRKIRIHFHEFMRDVHRQLDEHKGEADPLDKVAHKVAKKYRLICFDEFHISDVADAMIMYNFLSALFKEGVSFVMTSNYEPQALYPNGLHRDRLFPTIALLEEKLEVIKVDSGKDYREEQLSHLPVYLTPVNDTTHSALLAAYQQLAGVSEDPPKLLIESREITALRRSNGVIWFDFKVLCEGPRSQHDYLEIASQFHTVILSGVPQLSPAMSSAARRFTWLVDVLYDHHIKLILSAQVLAHELYVEGVLAHEFHRTVSRLIEMQSHAYMASNIRSFSTLAT